MFLLTVGRTLRGWENSEVRQNTLTNENHSFPWVFVPKLPIFKRVNLDPIICSLYYYFSLY